MSAANKHPSYRLHKPTGQAVVTIDRKDFYLGRFESPESRQKYNRIIGEWLIRGKTSPGITKDSATIALVISGYVESIKTEKSGETIHRIKMVLRTLNKSYGDCIAKDFGPLQLKALRQQICQHGNQQSSPKKHGQLLTRTKVNEMVSRIVSMFRWAAETDLVPASVWYAIKSVTPLARGSNLVCECRKITAPRLEDIEATIECMGTIHATMVRLQLLTGMRCGEVFKMRPCNIEMDGEVWRYKLKDHKTRKFVGDRTITLGPKAQELIKPFLFRSQTTPLFSSREAFESSHRWFFGGITEGFSHIPEQDRSARYKRLSKNSALHFNEEMKGSSYRLAITRALRRANAKARLANPDMPKDEVAVRPWHSHQLRHYAATFIRKHYGLDVARAQLGHTTTRQTEVYAELDGTKTKEAMLKYG